jgi:serine/threonine protein kinase
MSMEPGRNLLHYRLVDKIGEGGMGVVWKAVDTSLDREVAIKVLPDALAQDADRLARFEREAKLLASLNHQGIAGVYGFHESEGTRFISIELVEGQDLAARLERGVLPMDEVLAVSAQIAAALEAAHGQGVVHRDLKPANVVLTPDGRAKVLDFGLAKALAPDAASASGSLALSPTMTSTGTAAGMILGTAAYMSPEQARGKPVDRRADLWSFGCVLYECLTGVRLFAGETVSDSLAAILRKDPDWSLLPKETPPMVRLLLRRCLSRDPARRLQDAGDARLELEQAIEDPRGESLGLAVATEPTAAKPGRAHVARRDGVRDAGRRHDDAWRLVVAPPDDSGSGPDPVLREPHGASDDLTGRPVRRLRGQ